MLTAIDCNLQRGQSDPFLIFRGAGLEFSGPASEFLILTNSEMPPRNHDKDTEPGIAKTVVTACFFQSWDTMFTGLAHSRG